MLHSLCHTSQSTCWPQASMSTYKIRLAITSRSKLLTSLCKLLCNSCHSQPVANASPTSWDYPSRLIVRVLIHNWKSNYSTVIRVLCSRSGKKHAQNITELLATMCTFEPVKILLFADIVRFVSTA